MDTFALAFECLIMIYTKIRASRKADMLRKIVNQVASMKYWRQISKMKAYLVSECSNLLKVGQVKIP